MSHPARGPVHLATFAVVLRTVPFPVVAIAVLTMVPALVVAASGRHGFAGALSAASLVAGAGAGHAADDPAAPTLAPSPTTLAARRALRAAAIALLLGAAWGASLLVAHRYGHTTPDTSSFAAELAAAAAVSAAFAARARTDAPVSVGFGAAGASLLVMLVISAFAYRWDALPSLGGGATHARWWWVAVAGVVLAGWWSRDPAARGLMPPERPGARPGSARAASPGTGTRRPL